MTEKIVRTTMACLALLLTTAGQMSAVQIRNTRFAIRNCSTSDYSRG